MFQKKPSASEVDGVQYRRAKLCVSSVMPATPLWVWSVYFDRYGQLFGQHRLRHHHRKCWSHPDAGPHSDGFYRPDAGLFLMTASTPVSASCAFC